MILLPAHPAFFTHNFVSGMQSFYFSESQDAKVMQTCHDKKWSGLISLQWDTLIRETTSLRAHKFKIVNKSLRNPHLIVGGVLDKQDQSNIKCSYFLHLIVIIFNLNPCS